MNENLIKLYNEEFKDISFLKDYDKILSKPFLLKVHEDYIKAHKKIMVFGQETHRWHGKLIDFNKEDDIAKLMDSYEKFLDKRVFSQNKSRGRSCFIHRLVKINNDIKKNLSDTQIIWNNLLKFDKNGKSSRKIKKVTDFSIKLVKKEIDILKPDILLFQTGPYYDFIIKKLFTNIENSEVIVSRKLWKFTVDNKVSFRINHPCATNQGGVKQYYTQVINEIKNKN